MNDDSATTSVDPCPGPPGSDAQPPGPVAAVAAATAPGQAPAGPSSIADGVERRLDPRVMQVQRLAGGITTAATALGVAAVLVPTVLLTRLPGLAAAGLAGLWMVATLVLLWFTLRWPAITHCHTSYVVAADGIEIRRGVIWRTVINVPRSRVQHTDVSQGPIERRFGLGTLSTYTAGTDYAQVRLHGLERGTALRIRDHLLSRDASDAV